MRRFGTLRIKDPAVGREIAIDTTTCAHCNAVTLQHDQQGNRLPPEKSGGWCTLCGAPICPNCVGKECTPFEKRLERAEARGRLFRALGSY